MRKVIYRAISVLMVCMLVLGSSTTMSMAKSKKSKVTLNKKTITMTVGSTDKLKVKGSKKKTVWKSSNKNVVSVSKKGKLTAYTPGYATITAKVAGKKLKCKVTVIAPAAQAVVPPTYYTVTFNSNGGSEVPSVTVAAGQRIATPADPTRNEYGFAGWYLDEDFSNYFDFSSGVYGNITLHARWIKQTADYFVLSASKTDALIGADEEYYEDDEYYNDEDDEYYYDDEYGTSDELRFFLETDLEVDSIDLLETSDNSRIATMYDDGKYDEHGDDIAGDGIYSSFARDVYVDEDKPLSFFAEHGKYRSEEVTVNFYTPIAENTLSAMEAVNSEISELTESEDYQSMDEAGKKEAAITMLEGLDAVASNTISFDEESGVVLFEYPDGFSGGVPTKPFEPELNGTERDQKTERRAPLSEAEAEKIKTAKQFGMNTESVGNALILNAFPSFETDADSIDFRTDFYYDLEDEWDGKGLNTKVDTNVTVDDFRSLSSYDVVGISTHGSTFNSSPAICLAETATRDNNEKYSLELKTKQIVQVGSEYWVLPKFFGTVYTGNALEGTFVFAECCEFMGASGNWNYSMADALTNAKASAVVGFHNSVLAPYCRNFMKCFVDNLIGKKTAKQAFDAAVSKIGANDGQTKAAIPTFRGTASAKLINDLDTISNGSFENTYYKGSIEVPSNWNGIGDVRSLKKLGPLSPKDGSKMAILTTGIGSKTNATLATGTEGSCIYQNFKVPSSASSITLMYDYVSEEPMEWVGSEFNDSFGIQVIENGTVQYENIFESINSSYWIPIGGIDFDGGDETTYHTGWKSISIDASPYRNKTIQLKMIVYDEGDSAYDSAIILDKVSLN